MFKRNDKVHVYNSKMNGQPMYEGHAIVLHRTSVDDQYLVKFQDGTKVPRFVYEGECQEDPSTWVAKLTSAWKERFDGG